LSSQLFICDTNTCMIKLAVREMHGVALQ